MFVIPSLEEIQAALMAILDLKALDPDGFMAAFYKKYWDMVGG